MSLTAKELAAIEDQLGVEQTLIKKFTMYAHMASDPQLRTQFENNSARHQNHYNRLLAQLGHAADSIRRPRDDGGCAGKPEVCSARL